LLHIHVPASIGLVKNGFPSFSITVETDFKTRRFHACYSASSQTDTILKIESQEKGID